MWYPRKIQIGFQEGTCPLKCKKCHAFGEYAKEKKEVRKMPFNKAMALVDEISQMEVHPAIQPNIFAEPFTNEDLKEIIPYCCSKKIPINIITNGILLDNEWLALLIKYLDRTSVVSFSLDAVTQATYEKVRGNYKLIELEEKVKYLMKYRGNKGPRVSVNFVYEKDNFDEKDAFLEKWKGRVDAVRITAGLDSDKKIPAIYRKGDITRKKDVCPFLKEVMTIDSGGEVRSCPIDAFGRTYLGNVFEEGILPIWKGKKMNKFREAQRENQLLEEDFCYGCEWGYTTYDFNQIEETEDYIIKSADYAVYYNRKEPDRAEEGK